MHVRLIVFVMDAEFVEAPRLWLRYHPNPSAACPCKEGAPRKLKVEGHPQTAFGLP